jgi:hypothetical protein
MTFARLLFKYARNTSSRIGGNAECWENAGLLLRRNPGLTLGRAGNLSYGLMMIFSTETLHDSFTLLSKQWTLRSCINGLI